MKSKNMKRFFKWYFNTWKECWITSIPVIIVLVIVITSSLLYTPTTNFRGVHSLPEAIQAFIVTVLVLPFFYSMIFKNKKS